MNIQAKCAPAPIVPAAIQIPKAMIPTEIESEHASFMMTSKDPCLPDECQSVGKFGIDQVVEMLLVTRQGRLNVGPFRVFDLD